MAKNATNSKKRSTKFIHLQIKNLNNRTLQEDESKLESIKPAMVDNAWTLVLIFYFASNI